MAEQVVKLKKKQWFQILAPKQFGEVVIGETLVAEPQAMLGKTLSHNLMNLTNDPKRQNINIHFKVVGIDGNKGKTNIIGYQIVPSSVRRFVRRNSEKMDMSFACETADNAYLRVKPLVITKADVKGSIAAKVRNNIVQYLIKTIKKMSYNDIIGELISHKMQSDMRAALNKIYPLKVCEIRYLGIEIREQSSVPPSVERQKEAEIKAEAKEDIKAEVKEEKASVVEQKE